jgi:hypothetical protein
VVERAMKMMMLLLGYDLEIHKIDTGRQTQNTEHKKLILKMLMQKIDTKR